MSLLNLDSYSYSEYGIINLGFVLALQQFFFTVLQNMQVYTAICNIMYAVYKYYRHCTRGSVALFDPKLISRTCPTLWLETPH